jgi:hypothetical protein
LEAQPGSRLGLEASVDLTTWQRLTNFTVTTTPMQMDDPEAVRLNRRFYRAVAP